MTAKSGVDGQVRGVGVAGAHSTPKDVTEPCTLPESTRKNTLGVSMANIRCWPRDWIPSHDLAGALWKTGCYEARITGVTGG